MATQTQISNVCNILCQFDTRINGYQFGQRFDIDTNRQNNFDPKSTKGRMYPAVMVDIPDEVSSLGEPQHIGGEEETDMVLYFDTLQDIDNKGALVTINLVEKWDSLKGIATSFMVNFSAAMSSEKYGLGSIVGDVKYTQRESLFKDKILTWEVSFKFKHNAPCTDDLYIVDLSALPDVLQDTDIERTDSDLLISPCQALVISLEQSEECKCSTLKIYDFSPASDVDFDCLSAPQVSDLTTRLSVAVPYENSYSMTFGGINQNLGLLHDTAFDFERTDPFSFSIRFKYQSAAELMILMAKQQTGAPFRGYAFSFDPATQKFQMSLKSTVTTNEIRVDSEAQSLIIGGVYDIAFTYDGSSSASGVKMYLDSLPIATEAPIIDNLTATTKSTVSLFFANFSTIYTQTELNIGRLWDVALTPAQIVTDYNGGTPDFPILPLNLIFDCTFGDGGLFSFDIMRWVLSAINDMNSFQSANTIYANRIAAI